MSRLVAAPLVMLLVGLPLTVLPAAYLAALAALAGLVCGAGIVAFSVPVLTAGATLAIVEYALALSISKAPFGLPTAIGFGAALFLLIEVGDLAGRLRGAAVDGAVLRAVVRYWLAIVGIGAVLVAALAAVAAAAGRAAVLPESPLTGALVALGALLAAVGVSRLVAGGPRGESTVGDSRRA
jgi:hypothetical protein